DADALVSELRHRRAARVAAGPGVVPAAGVERVALEALDAGDARQLRLVERSGSHRDEARADAITAVGVDDPARRRVVPLEQRDVGREQRVLAEPERLGDLERVRPDLGGERVLYGRTGADL